MCDLPVVFLVTDESHVPVVCIDCWRGLRKASRTVRGLVVFLVASFGRDISPFGSACCAPGGEGRVSCSVSDGRVESPKGLRRYHFSKGERCRHGDESSFG